MKKQRQKNPPKPHHELQRNILDDVTVVVTRWLVLVQRLVRLQDGLVLHALRSGSTARLVHGPQHAPVTNRSRLCSLLAAAAVTFLRRTDTVTAAADHDGRFVRGTRNRGTNAPPGSLPLIFAVSSAEARSSLAADGPAAAEAPIFVFFVPAVVLFVNRWKQRGCRLARARAVQRLGLQFLREDGVEPMMISSADATAAAAPPAFFFLVPTTVGGWALDEGNRWRDDGGAEVVVFIVIVRHHEGDELLAIERESRGYYL